MKDPVTCLSKGVTVFILLISGCLGYALPGVADEGDTRTSLWEALRSGGHVALMRHALAPGTGDPPEFSIVDCSTQRNLSDEGREQAKRIGDRFRANGISSAAVYSSQWCRCVDTAELLGLGLVKELSILNSVYLDFERRQPQTQKLRKWIASQKLNKPLVLVTHQVNINALTNVYTSSGEMIIVRRNDDGEITVLGSIQVE